MHGQLLRRVQKVVDDLYSKIKQHTATHFSSKKNFVAVEPNTAIPSVEKPSNAWRID